MATHHKQNSRWLATIKPIIVKLELSLERMCSNQTQVNLALTLYGIRRREGKKKKPLSDVQDSVVIVYLDRVPAAIVEFPELISMG